MYELRLKLNTIYSAPSMSLQIEDWSTEDLVRWLSDLNLRADYSVTIRQGEYDGRNLIDFYEEDNLKEIISKPADIATVKNCFKKLL